MTPEDVDAYFDRRNWADLYGDDARAELETLFEAVLVQEGLPTSQAHLLAVEYAGTRAGELISNLEDFTRRSVKSVVAQTIRDGRPVQELAKALREHDVFSANRARTVARTETAISLGQGKKQSAVSQGRDQKLWQANPNACDICQENETGEWLAVDEAFPDGGDTIPAHPNCECSVAYRTAALHEED